MVVESYTEVWSMYHIKKNNLTLFLPEVITYSELLSWSGGSWIPVSSMLEWWLAWSWSFAELAQTTTAYVSLWIQGSCPFWKTLDNLHPLTNFNVSFIFFSYSIMIQTEHVQRHSCLTFNFILCSMAQKKIYHLSSWAMSSTEHSQKYSAKVLSYKNMHRFPLETAHSYCR